MQSIEANQTAMPWLHVVAAVIQSGAQVLLAKRPTDKHQGGKWEFPGGKVEKNEPAFIALRRELQEELGIVIDPDHAEPYMEIRHAYGDKNIFLDVWKITQFSGEPKGLEGQQIGWFSLSELASMDFPAANAAIIDKLNQPV